MPASHTSAVNAGNAGDEGGPGDGEADEGGLSSEM